MAASILSKIEELAKSRNVPCKAVLVGSAARNTWLSGDHDMDIFIAMPEDQDLGLALEIARLVAPHHEEKYAEHAYVHATLDCFEIDLVPCYQVKDASRIKSAVDRTPFHNEYITARVRGLEDEVLLLKQFMKGIGVYGSELRVGGFSGYLVELLVISFGSFPGVLRSAENWRPNEVIFAPESSQIWRDLFHEDPLVVIDPVDPKRNVAAALTLDRMFQFVAAARCFLKQPSLDFFFPAAFLPLSDEEVLGHMERRKSALIVIELPVPHLSEDILFPQLRKAEHSIAALFELHGFDVLRSDALLSGGSGFREDDDRASGFLEAGPGSCQSAGSGDEGIARLLFELEVWELSSVKRHPGPPVWEAEHVERFLSRHIETISGPYIQGGRAVVEISRRYTEPRGLLEREMVKLALGKHIRQQVEKGYRIYLGQEILQIRDLEFRSFLARYFLQHNHLKQLQ
jgi:tRNA nucleotidyltransferase (CCA-adding enzyme)